MNHKTLNILLIEDNAAQALLLQKLLQSRTETTFNFDSVQRLADALEKLAQPDSYDIILLDLTLPDSQGLSGLEKLCRQAINLPIVVLTNYNDEALALEAVRCGAQDYIGKRHITPELLVRSMQYAIERKQTAAALRRANEDLEVRVQDRTAELAQAKELAQVTLSSIGDAVICTNAQGLIESVNPAAVRLLGLSESEAQGLALSAVFSCGDSSTCVDLDGYVTQVLDNDCVLEPIEQVLRRKSDGKSFVVQCSVAPIGKNQLGTSGAVLVCRDISRTHALANQLAWQANHDALTGLLNRVGFENYLQSMVEASQASDAQHVLCYLDLDQFKVVNDTCGHAVGDLLLQQVAALLQSQLGTTAVLARLGGDEFGLILPDCATAEGKAIAHQLLESMRAYRFTWQEQTFAIGVSIGLVPIDATLKTCATVLSIADSTLYVAKEQGRNQIYVYEANDQDLARRHGEMQWVSRIIQALEADRFCLYYQPIMPIHTSNPAQHYELLIRMLDEQGQVLSPVAFIPAAERYSLMSKIDRWVVAEVCSHWSKIVEYFSFANPLLSLSHQACRDVLTINLSGASLVEPEFLEFVQNQIFHNRVPPAMLCFEITEHFAITNLDRASQFIHHLKAIGCRFALDDFGTGMSSLTYLKNLPVDYLKIDGSFIKTIVDDPVNAAMVEAISRIANVMGLSTIAEYVENGTIFHKLKALNIDYAQGYGIGKPQRLPLGSRSGEWSPLLLGDHADLQKQVQAA